MRLKPSVRNGLLYCLFFAILAGWLAADYFKSLEYSAYDAHMRNSEILTHPDIVLITIDDISIEKIGDDELPRDLLAKVIDYLDGANPSLIATTELMPLVQEEMSAHQFDLQQKKIDRRRQELLQAGVTNDPTLDLWQKELDEAIQTIQTDSVLAAAMQEAEIVFLPVTLHPVMSKTQSESVSKTAKKKYAIVNRTSNTFNKNPQAYKVRTSNSVLVEAADQFGHINKELDSDGVIRRERLFWPVENYLVPSLAMRVYAQHRINQQSIDLINEPFAPEALSEDENRQLKFGDLNLDFPANGKVLSRFYSGKKTETFKRFSFYDVFVEAIPLQEFEHKVILIGTTAAGISNRNKLSSGQNLAAIEYLAQVSSSLLNDDWIRRGHNQRVIEGIIYLLIAIYLIGIAPRQKILINTLITSGIIASLLIFEFGSLEFSYWYKFITPILFLFFGMMTLSVSSLRYKEFARARLSRERDNTSLQLGLAFQQQGALDLALEKFIDCTPSKNLLSPLYNLGLEYERKRQFAKASAVYEYMSKIDENYLDIDQRKNQSKEMAMNSTQQIFGAESRLASLLKKGTDMENPRLGRYEIEDEIGRGAMSIVYAGKDPTINRTVAIKVQSFVGDDEAQLSKMRERFLTEAKTAGALNHPDIITIYDIGEEVDLIYIAMEYLQGKPLEYFVHDQRLDDDTILMICLRIARALEYAHKHKVIHRDVKPSNIIYNKSTNDVHLTDFGIARMQDAHLTQTGQVVGTPSYMSPEQITGKRVDHRSDLFSLGATMYQLFTGKLPFQADTMATLLYKITMESPIPFDAIRPDLPIELADIISKLLEKEADERYQSAEELANALEHCKNSLKNTL